MRGTVGTAPGTTTLQLADGSKVALADWIDDRMFGSVALTTGQAAPVECFAAGRSQAIPGGARVQTRVDTNLPRNGDNGLPKDWEMLVYGIGVRATRATRTPWALATYSNPVRLQTLFDIDRVTSLDFSYNGKSYSTGIMSDYPQGNGYYVFATTNNFEYAQNGTPSPRDRTALVLPIHMRENLSFKLTFQPESALAIAQPAADGAANLDMVEVKATLYGLIKRSVV